MPSLEAATIALTEIAESAREGLLALTVGTGLQVMQAWMKAHADRLWWRAQCVRYPRRIAQWATTWDFLPTG